jgi:hypothetical protein
LFKGSQVLVRGIEGQGPTNGQPRPKPLHFAPVPVVETAPASDRRILLLQCPSTNLECFSVVTCAPYWRQATLCAGRVNLAPRRSSFNRGR